MSLTPQCCSQPHKIRIKPQRLHRTLATLCSRQPPGPRTYRCPIGCYCELQAMTRLLQRAFSLQLCGCRLQLWWTILRWSLPEMWNGALKAQPDALLVMPRAKVIRLPVAWPRA